MRTLATAVLVGIVVVGFPRPAAADLVLGDTVGFTGTIFSDDGTFAGPVSDFGSAATSAGVEFGSGGSPLFTDSAGRDIVDTIDFAPVSSSSFTITWVWDSGAGAYDSSEASFITFSDATPDDIADWTSATVTPTGFTGLSASDITVAGDGESLTLDLSALSAVSDGDSFVVTVSTAAVPEPSSCALIGLAAIAGRAIRRRRAG